MDERKGTTADLFSSAPKKTGISSPMKEPTERDSCDFSPYENSENRVQSDGVALKYGNCVGLSDRDLTKINVLLKPWTPPKVCRFPCPPHAKNREGRKKMGVAKPFE